MGMNLLHVIPYYAPAWAYGGSVRAATDLTRALVQAGHCVTVLTTDTLSPTARAPVLRETLDGVDVVRVRNLSNALRGRLNLASPLGMGRAALEVAARYADKRKAFGKKIRSFEAVSFKVADSITQLDAARMLVYGAARSIDAGDDPSRCRRLVSEAKKFATETAWQLVNHAMQILGGIGYTNIYPIERLLRDTRLIMIWTGTNEIMDLIIQSEYYKELLGRPGAVRDVEADAEEAEREEEKVYE